LLHLRAVPLAEGRGGAAVFVDDISEIKRIESVRRDFVANVSHELKTPIGALETAGGDDRDRGRPRRHQTARRAHGERRLSGSVASSTTSSTSASSKRRKRRLVTSSR